MSYLIHGNARECIKEEFRDLNLREGYFLTRSAEDRAESRLAQICGKENGHSLGMLGMLTGVIKTHFS